MVTKYNVGDTVLVPMTINSIEASGLGIKYFMNHHPRATTHGRYLSLDEEYIHSILQQEEPPAEEGVIPDVQ